jgi:hypothetical protein
MYRSQNIIMWEKWHDPFGLEDIEAEEETYDEDHYEDSSVGYKKTKKIRSQVIATPFGIIPINENTASGEIFNFWTGHTNFALTQKISSIIENTSGVETLNIFTKYRFRVGIGKAFTDSEVMRSINSNVYQHLENNNV